MVQFAPWTQPPSTQQASVLPLVYWSGQVWGAHKIASIQGSSCPARPQAQSISHGGRYHFRNQKRSSISIDFSSSLNCYLLWESVPSWHCCLAKENTGLASLNVRSRAWHPIDYSVRIDTWMNERVAFCFLISVGAPADLKYFWRGETQIDELGHWLKNWWVAVCPRNFLMDAWDQGDLEVFSSTSRLSHQCSPRQPGRGLDHFY